jgi:hypothetical protein
MGRVVPDEHHPGMYRVALSAGRVSEPANLSWAKDSAMAAAIRELIWEAPPYHCQKMIAHWVKGLGATSDHLGPSQCDAAVKVASLAGLCQRYRAILLSGASRSRGSGTGLRCSRILVSRQLLKYLFRYVSQQQFTIIVR